MGVAKWGSWESQDPQSNSKDKNYYLKNVQADSRQ